jgi:hypothetical protein
MTRAFSITGVALALALGFLGSPAIAPAEAATPAGPHQLALGFASVPYADMANVDAHTSTYGRTPALWTVWSDWGRANAAFPAGMLNGLRARGIVPLVIWEPTLPPATDFNWDDVLAGNYDTYIRSWAQSARDWGGSLVLRFAHEMDGDWFPWGIGHGTNTAAKFVAGWQHVWNIFRGPGGVGATNVKFLWSPTIPKSQFYPGDAYVDFVGFSAFNWNMLGWPGWWSLNSFLSFRTGKARQITKKPIIVAETGSTSIGGNKANWITKGYTTAYAKYPYIVAIIYFDVNMLPGQVDWRLTTPSAASTAYKNLLTQPAFQGTLIQPRVSIKLPPALSVSTPAAVNVNVTLSQSDANGTGINGWYVSESSTTPGIFDPAWQTTPPTSFTLSAGYGAKTVYAWVRDLNGIISPTASATTVLGTPTTTSVTSDVNPSAYGQGVTFTATVSSTAGTVSGGTVRFQSDGTNLVGCTAQPVTAGAATCGPITGLPANGHPITAYFSGGATFAGSNNAAAPYSQIVGQASTTTAVSSDVNASTFGQSVTFTATISSPGGIPGRGSVEFKSDGVDIAGCTAAAVSAGSATCGPVNWLAAGAHNITADYSGSANYTDSNNSAAPFIQNVGQATTTMSVSSDANPSTFGQGVTFTATISSAAGTVLYGAVEFQSDGVDIVGCQAVPVSSGTATCGPITDLAIGAHDITAYSSGSSDFAGSDNGASPYSQSVE